MGFTKLDERITRSSIMAESSDTFKVWITLLAECREDGVAYVSEVYLSTICHLSLDAVMSSIHVLESPDKMSRSKEYEGRRIRRVDGGFYIINYQKYRLHSYSTTKEAIRKRKYRGVVIGGDIVGHIGTSKDTSGHSASVSSSLNINTKEESYLIDEKLVNLLIELMLRNYPKSYTIKHLTTKGKDDWINTARLMREQDERTPQEIYAVIRFSQDDNFWKNNIRSMGKLREQWDQLWMKMQRANPPKQKSASELRLEKIKAEEAKKQK